MNRVFLYLFSTLAFLTILSVGSRPDLLGAAVAQQTDSGAAVVLRSEAKNANFRITIKDILGKPRHGRVTVRNLDGPGGMVISAADGEGAAQLPAGKYIGRIEVFDGLIPYVVSIEEFEVSKDGPALLEYELLEGVAGSRPLSAFDTDADMVIDSAEVAAGSDPNDAMSIPGTRTHSWPAQVKSRDAGWFQGELHAHSNYGVGKESVADVIKRAEKAGLDFLAIMDRNTLGPALDEDYESDEMVLIPGMEWGDDRNGVALVYAPGSMPPPIRSDEEMDAYARLIQAQGGLVFAAHPCFPTGPWNRRLRHLNGVEAWCMDWRSIPPIATAHLVTSNLKRDEGEFVYPIARAANLPLMSANSQAVAYWGFEMIFGRPLTLIGGSQSGSRKVDIARPVTHVYATEKSLRAILEGLRLGRTFVSEGLDGPKIQWVGDILDDGSIDVSIGGSVPIDHPTRYFVRVLDGKGKKLEIVTNGVTSIATEIPNNDWIFPYGFTPEHYEVYTVRVVSTPEEEGFGIREVHAMTSPIYAQVILHDSKVEGADIGVDGWVRIENEYMAPAQIDAFMEHVKANSKSAN